MLTLAIRRRRLNQDDSLIPLINIVFLMLIFFMVAGQVSQSDSVKVETPHSTNDKKVVPDSLTVLVSKQGDIYVDGEVVLQAQLTRFLMHLRGETEQKALPAIVVKADGQLDVEHLQSILKTIKAAGMSRLALMTSPDKGAE